METRSIPLAILFSFLTCGIYFFYWIFKTAQGFDGAATQEKVGTTAGITLLLIIVTGGIYGYYCYYKWGRATSEISARYGREDNDRAVLYLILAIVGLSIVNLALIQSDFNNWVSRGQ
ncbi:MAG: DUF4234 domain-containing protein [Gracilibacteraceae bacterium]|jgi:uncharacterized membrane protein YidH (DUF202 family)|nr:DUF4234 domain-containing protein [Gracilibacteraceae bacterium]